MEPWPKIDEFCLEREMKLIDKDEDGFQKLWDEVNNHPNDPISENACKKLKQYLSELQEWVKKEGIDELKS